MKPVRPLISARYLTWLSRHAAGQGIDLAALNTKVGLSQTICDDPDGEIPCTLLALAAQLLADATDNDAYVLDFVESLPTRPSGVYQTIIFHSRTFRDALCAMCRFSALMTDAFAMQYAEDDESGTVVFDFPAELKAYPQFVAGEIAIIAVRARQLLGPSIRPTQVSMTIAPPRQLARYHSILGRNIQFGRAENTITFSREALHRPLPGADPELAEQLNRYGDELLEEMRTARPLQRSVEHFIRGALQRGEATEAGVCLALGIGRRTLQRELLAAGTSFRRILEQERMRAAEQYLVTSDISVTAISALLGYSELSAFSRACKVWFGRTPSAMRRQGAVASKDIMAYLI